MPPWMNGGNVLTLGTFYRHTIDVVKVAESYLDVQCSFVERIVGVSHASLIDPFSGRFDFYLMCWTTTVAHHYFFVDVLLFLLRLLFFSIVPNSLNDFDPFDRLQCPTVILTTPTTTLPSSTSKSTFTFIQTVVHHPAVAGTSSVAPSATASSTPVGGASTGVIVGGILPAVLGAAGILTAVVYFLRCRRHSEDEAFFEEVWNRTDARRQSAILADELGLVRPYNEYTQPSSSFGDIMSPTSTNPYFSLLMHRTQLFRLFRAMYLITIIRHNLPVPHPRLRPSLGSHRMPWFRLQ
ncbi:hypothetical protein BJV78DRAFT_1356424 [Lactifluus subvellereus]|nr:hypothetical protein BJV78DRAFT_1356424 [Lactifluus subvellereus]